MLQPSWLQAALVALLPGVSSSLLPLAGPLREATAHIRSAPIQLSETGRVATVAATAEGAALRRLLQQGASEPTALPSWDAAFSSAWLRLFELSRACRHHHPPAHLHPTPAPQLPTCKQRSARASPRCARSDGGGGRWWTASGSRSKQRSCAIISTSSPTSPSSRPAQTSHRVPPHFPRSRSDSRGSLLVRCA